MEPIEPSPTISSFVIRFVHGEGGSAGEQAIDAHITSPSFRCTIRHVQTDQEQAFTRWDDVVAFIQQFVPLQAAEKSASEGEP